MNILTIAKTGMAGAPVALSKIINKYTEHKCRSLLGRYFSSGDIKDLKWDYDYVDPSKKLWYELKNWADIVIHNKEVWGVNIGKPQVILYHAVVKHVPKKTDPLFNGRKMVVAQHQARHFPDAEMVPNLVDIYEDYWIPKYKKDKIVLYMGLASETKGGWGCKNSTGVLKIFKELQKKYPDRVEISFLKGRPMSEVHKKKQWADIVVDECMTGSYHLSSLEGLSVGAVTFNNIDGICQKQIRELTGTDSMPFVRTPMHNLKNMLEHYIKDESVLRAKQAESRRWAETYWNPKKMVNKYINFFKRFVK